MFVIVYNNSVILGPMRWNRFRFENEIQEECEHTCILPDRNDSLEAITVSGNVKILPVAGTPDPDFNPKIQFLNGPFWEFTETQAISSYRVENLGIEAVKSTLKEQVAAERWKKENAGVTVTVNGTEYAFASNKETRATLTSSTNLTSINWKINRDVWINMTGADAQNILNAILTHVQNCFDWELSKIQEIDACTTLQELDELTIIEE